MHLTFVDSYLTLTFLLRQPEGGVQEGQVFLAPLPDTFKGPHLDVPTGSWKDGLFACCSLGPCHPHLWCAICCPQILMAQIMMRLQLTWLGEPGPLISTKYTFQIVTIIVCCYVVYSTSLEIYSQPYDVNTIPTFVPVLKTIGSIMFSVWALYSLCKTRENTRARYSIPEERCKGCEDCCCAFFCSCCTVAQLARHTGDYENYAGVCCSATGHPKGSPLVV
jgi:Cys-rich protein (TIGR01571 family)